MSYFNTLSSIEQDFFLFFLGELTLYHLKPGTKLVQSLLADSSLILKCVCMSAGIWPVFVGGRAADTSGWTASIGHDQHCLHHRHHSNGGGQQRRHRHHLPPHPISSGRFSQHYCTNPLLDTNDSQCWPLTLISKGDLKPNDKNYFANSLHVALDDK